MRPDPLSPPKKKGTNCPLLIRYSNLLATSIFIETPVSLFCYLSKVQYSHKRMYLTTCLIQLAAQSRCKGHDIILLRLGMLCNVEGFNKFKLFMTTHNNIVEPVKQIQNRLTCCEKAVIACQLLQCIIFFSYLWPCYSYFFKFLLCWANQLTFLIRTRLTCF